MAFDPDKWATSLMRELKSYLTNGLELTGGNLDPYEVVESYPAATDLSRLLPLKRTLIHFEIDEPRQVPFGFGDNVVNRVYDETPGEEEVEEWEAHCHEVSINVGVWASVESGGISARMEALNDLTRLFNGPSAREALMAASDGIELLSFTGGQFVTDQINDILVFRVIDMELRVRVYSRTKKAPAPYWTDIDQSPGLEIDETVIIG